MAVSNYELARLDAARLFSQANHAVLIRRFGLSTANGYLQMPFFGQPFRVSLETGNVERAVDGNWEAAGYNESMTFYDLLGYAQPTCHASRNMINTKSLHTQIAAAAPSSGSFYARQKALFEQNASHLQGILEALGGVALGKADASAQFTVMDDLTMQVHFWRADEDFPPSLELFWDQNVLQYMHYETVWYANGFIVNEIEAQLAPCDR